MRVEPAKGHEPCEGGKHRAALVAAMDTDNGYINAYLCADCRAMIIVSGVKEGEGETDGGHTAA